MLIAAFGLPGVMTAWGFAAVRTLARESLDDVTVLETDCLEPFAQACALRSCRERHLVVLSQYPEPELIAAVLDAGARPVMFMENLVDGVAYLAATTRQEPMSLVRAVSTSAACLAALREQPTVLTLRRDALAGRRIDLLVAYMGDHAGLDIDRATLEVCTRHLGQAQGTESKMPCLEQAAARTIDGYIASGGGADALPHDVASLADTLLTPLAALFLHRTLPTIHWPGTVFSRADTAADNPTADIVLAGGARCLVYGPYLCLPAGHWAARAIMTFGEHTRDQTFVLEVVAGHAVERLRFVPDRAGLHAARWTFETTAPHVPIEIRLLMENGAIEGNFSLVEIELQYLEEAQAQATTEVAVEPNVSSRPKNRTWTGSLRPSGHRAAAKRR